MEAQVFEQQHLAVFELARQLAGEVADAVRREGDVDLLADGVIEHDAQAVDDGPQAVLRIRLALGAAQVRAEDDLAAWRSAYSMVGRVSRMRVSSRISVPSSESGTLKSTRMKTCWCWS